MEIEIQSKKENPMLNRTEVHFIVHHEGESTPRRERVRGELAEKLNVKKDLIIVNAMNSKFGLHITKGYAKVYSKPDFVQNGERDHILKRNTTGGKKEKQEIKEEPTKQEETAETQQGESTEQPADEKTEKPETEPANPEAPSQEQPSEEKKE